MIVLFVANCRYSPRDETAPLRQSARTRSFVLQSTIGRWFEMSTMELTKIVRSIAERITVFGEKIEISLNRGKITSAIGVRKNPSE